MKSCFLVLALLSVTYAAPRANEKVISIEDNEIPVKKVKGVGVQWGGYRAGAGLGGSESGGGLYAGAEAPGAQAGAGLYGNGASAGSSASAGSFSNTGLEHGQQGGFFDRIFSIPINVLHSVNTYVKTKNNGQGAHAQAGSAGVGANAGGVGAGVGFSGAEAGAGAGAGAGVGAGAGASAGAGIGADSSVRFASDDSASASVGGDHVHHKRLGGRPDYDKIFNIPITALKSVNDFLSG